MHPEILSTEQNSLLPLLKLFRREFYLVGGTAIALQIGHRKSIDFDLFKSSPLNTRKILDKISVNNYRFIVTRRVREQLNLTVLNVKMTFFEYPYPIESNVDFNSIFRMPDLLALAAMKAFALGRRSKWKDYVDMYFILRSHFEIEDIVHKAESIYGQEFSGKLFRSQLAYHADIDYTEGVDFLEGNEVEPEEVKAFLINKSLDWGEQFKPSSLTNLS
ncbi:MAG: nucleotidyl transferase AbiEii/AbiGii toxin family protein [Tannerellaceae bacterium]|jgi:hypothetical protein|nr:nucleotidyl transferase AbiEii/AbiGii toxin family protein [Tannerellaceae bacterium]